MRIIVFFAIAIVLTVLWRLYKRSRRPENYKDMCVCKHARTTHITYTNFRNIIMGRCSECDCPEFVLNKTAQTGAYLWRREGPTYRTIHFIAMSITAVLVAILPRHALYDLTCRLQDWARRLEKKTEERDKDDESTPLS